MADELILKKLEQMKELMQGLDSLLRVSADVFVRDLVSVRAAERNFQLLVDLASDINAQILLQRGRKTPDTYKQSFVDLQKEGVLDDSIVGDLILSAKVRNILVHEYDFEEDYTKFYLASKEILPAYQKYIKIIFGYTQK